METTNLISLAQAGNAEAQAQLAQQALIKHDKDAAWKWANLSAAQNCPLGICALGSCYLAGYNTEKDPEKANELYQKAADMGCARGITGLSGIMIEKEGKVSREALALLRKAADANDAKALYLLAMLHRDGVNVVRSLPRCKQLFEKSAEQDYAPALYELSLIYLNENDKEKCDELLKQAAEQGLPIAETLLGELIQDGEMGEVDDDKAFKLYSHAASAGCREALRDLGFCYLYGEGVEVDTAAAEEYFKRAAELGLDDCKELIELARNGGSELIEEVCDSTKPQFDYRDEIEAAAAKGDPEALLRQSIFYFEGKAGDVVSYEKNDSKALECVKKSAEAGFASAELALGNIYIYGSLGVEQDISVAMGWFKKAAMQGNAKAMINLARCFITVGIPDEAVKWLEKACEAGDGVAFGMLSELYMDGLGIEQDFNKAFALAKQGADLGDARSDSIMGTCYLRGQGVEQDIDTAIDWFISASNKGYAYAMIYLGNIFMGDIGDQYTDYQLAEEQLIQATNQNNPEAAYQLVRLYIHFTHEHDKAYNALCTAADLGDTWAAEILAIFQKKEEGNEQ